MKPVARSHASLKSRIRALAVVDADQRLRRLGQDRGERLAENELPVALRRPCPVSARPYRCTVTAVAFELLAELGDGEAPAVGDLHARRERDLVRVGEHVEQHRAGVRERRRDRGVELVGVLDADAVQAQRAGDRGEVGVVQHGAELGQPALLLLELDHAEAAVVEDDELDRQVVG